MEIVYCRNTCLYEPLIQIFLFNFSLRLVPGEMELTLAGGLPTYFVVRYLNNPFFSVTTGRQQLRTSAALDSCWAYLPFCILYSILLKLTTDRKF